MGAGTKRLGAGEKFTLIIDFTPPAPPSAADVVDNLTDGIDLALQGLIASITEPTGAVAVNSLAPVSGWVATPQGGPNVNSLEVTVVGPVETSDANKFNKTLNRLLRAVQTRDDDSPTNLTAQVSKNIDQNGKDNGPAPDDG